MPITAQPRSFVYDTWVAAGTVINANGNSGTFEGYEGARELVIQVVASAVSGTSPSLTIALQDTVDGTNYSTVASATAITAAGTTTLRVPITTPFSGRLRLNYTLTGSASPSVTLGVSAYAARASA